MSGPRIRSVGRGIGEEADPIWVVAEPNYSRIDGLRPFTGVVGGVNPILDSHLTTKQYVDLAVSSLHLTEFLTDTVSDIDGYYKMCIDLSTLSNVTSAAFDYSESPQLLFKFLTCLGEPGLDRLVAGTYTSHVHIYKTGNKYAQVYYELWRTDADGVEIAKLGTSALTGDIDESPAQVKNIQVVLTDEVTLDITDRIAIKWFAYTESGGQNITVTIEIGGTQDSNFAININPLALRSIFVSNPLTENLDFANYQALNFIVEAVDALPDPAVAGRIIKLTTDKRIYFGLEV